MGDPPLVAEKDACINDSGGPLVGQVDDQWVVVGVASGGIRCWNAVYDWQPGVYVSTEFWWDEIWSLAQCDRVVRTGTDANGNAERFQACNIALSRDLAEEACGPGMRLIDDGGDEPDDFEDFPDIGRYTDDGTGYWAETNGNPGNCEYIAHQFGMSETPALDVDCDVPRPFVCHNGATGPGGSSTVSIPDGGAATPSEVLRDAIETANDEGGTVRIEVTGGTNSLGCLTNEVDSILRGEMEIVGTGSGDTLQLSCSDEGRYGIIVEGTLKLSNLTLDGQGSTSGSTSVKINALDVRGSGRVEMEDVTVKNFVSHLSTVRCRNGYYSRFDTDEWCTFTRVQFINNRSLAGTSGAGALSVGRTAGVIVRDRLFKENATGGSGAAISFTNGGYGSVLRTVFVENEAGKGAAVSVREANVASKLLNEPNTTTTNTFGHGEWDGDFGIRNSAFLRNDNGSGGGSVFYLEEPQVGLRLRNVSVDQSSSYVGDVIDGDGTVFLENSLIRVPNAGGNVCGASHPVLFVDSSRASSHPSGVTDTTCDTSSSTTLSSTPEGDIFSGSVTVQGESVPGPDSGFTSGGGALESADDTDITGAAHNVSNPARGAVD